MECGHNGCPSPSEFWLTTAHHHFPRHGVGLERASDAEADKALKMGSNCLARRDKGAAANVTNEYKMTWEPWKIDGN